MIRTMCFVTCILGSQTLAAQMKLLEDPKVKPGVEVIADAKAFFDAADNFVGFDDLKPKTIINDKFKKLGLKLSSSNSNNSVEVTFYSFPGGRSGKHSIASSEPKYQGKMTISFEKRISSVGFHLSHVNPGGTMVDAFDRENKLLGRFVIAKTKSGLAFCGLKSKTPIAKLVVSPVMKIDPDFAIDDLAFNFAGEK